MNEKFMQILGWVATLTAMAMYFSYIPQISGNLNNDKGLASTARGGDQLQSMGNVRTYQKA